MSRNPLQATLIKIIEPVVQAAKLELVDVRFLLEQGGWTLRVQIDMPVETITDVNEVPTDRVSLLECEQMSRELSAVLDVEDPIPNNYTLEVSSPGIDRPLTRPKDYARWSGHLARFELALPINGQRRFKGTLLGIENDTVRVKLDDGTEAQLPLASVTRAKLEITDALLAEHQRTQTPS